MKKLTSFIPVVLMFIILAGLLFFMCLPQNQSRVKAKNGVLDLRGETDKSNITPLHGEWDFLFGELLTPGEFATRQAETIAIPGSWDNAGYPLNGFATYRLTVLTDEQGALTIFLPEICSAYVLLVNGEIVRTSGTLSAESGSGQPHFENALVSVRAENGTVELILQISNYHFTNSGITGTILIGGSESIQTWFFRTRAFYCIALGCFLMAAFYHLTLYIYRRREKTYLLFALLCFLCFARFLMETNGLNEYFQWIPMGMLGIRFYLALFFSHSIAISAFSLYVFNREFLLIHRTAIITYFTLVFLISLITPTNTAVYLIVTTPVALSVALFSIIMAARSCVLKDNSITRLYFAAMIFYLIIGTSSKLFLDNTLFMMGLLSNMFMILSQSLVLSRRYTYAFKLVEETNENLEKIVDSRTKDLQNTNAAMKELVGNISHDLKTPLAVMSVNLEELSNLSQTLSDEDYARCVRVVYQKNLDLQRLIQNLIEISRIETEQNILRLDWIPLTELFSKAQDKYDDFLKGKNIFFEIYYTVNAEIYADPQRIWSVFDNIVYNAARYTGEGGTITINAASHVKTAVITITDIGCGIAAEHLPHIFERFYKADPARGASDGDSGLGLYIVKSIMEASEGSVTAKSELGKGTSIVLNFVKKTD